MINLMQGDCLELMKALPDNSIDLRLSICQLDNQYRWLRQGGGWFDVPYLRYWMPIEPPKEE